MTMDRRSFVATAAATVAAGNLRVSIPSDPLGVRADFPITTERTYLNSAYIAPVPRTVVQAGAEFLENKSKRPLEVGELLGGDGKLRNQFAQLINASPDEVGLLFSTAEGENIIAQGMDLRPGDNVVIDELHYPTEFVLYRALEASKGIELRIAKHRHGVVDLNDFTPLVDDKTRIVSVAWVSHLNGFRHDMRPIADLAHAHGAVFYADAIQAVGMIAIDVQAAGVDAICAGSYKWMLAG
ncbi:MAG TPA: aminotransferase class V-fold PLP-dependent enzyme, partial [Gemmatimonadales bacterium]|nr:aminotransferase class V-fold PLP-dependent enzyme [Gemmatimonadales bacterium]